MSVDPNYYFNTGGQGGLTGGQGGLTSGLGRCGLGGANQNAFENFNSGDNNQVFIYNLLSIILLSIACFYFVLIFTIPHRLVTIRLKIKFSSARNTPITYNNNC